MDWLLEIEDELAEAGVLAVADLLNLEVDLLFFDTTSTYFETEARRRARRRARPSGSAPTASPRTTATTCPRS